MKVWFSDTTYSPKGWVKIDNYDDAVAIFLSNMAERWHIDMYSEDARKFYEVYSDPGDPGCLDSILENVTIREMVHHDD